MKKIITMALVLVMVFGLAAPALAYTGNTPPAQGTSPYTVDIYLVEYLSSDLLSGWIGAPPSDRGYAKNEVIAAVGQLNIPANYNAYADAYRAVQFKPKNVTLDVVDNIRTLAAAASRNDYRLHHTVSDTEVKDNSGTTLWTAAWDGTTAIPLYWTRNSDNGNLTHIIMNSGPFATLANATTALAYDRDINNLPATFVQAHGVIPNKTTAQTYRWLVFGKVTGDDAKLTFALTRNEGFTSNITGANATRLVTTLAAVGQWNSGYDATTNANGMLPQLASGTGGPLGSTLSVGAPMVQNLLVLNDEIIVGRTVNQAIGANRYYVFGNPDTQGYAYVKGGTVAPDDIALIIDTGARGKTTALYIYPSGVTGKGYAVVNESSLEEVIFVELTSAGRWNPIRSGNTGYAALRMHLDTWFDKLGFSVANIGNLLNQSDWHALAAAAWDVTETVDIEPWTPYVSVPDNIVTDPPKTGDLSVMGFVMIALAAAAAVVVRKVRA